MCEMHEFHRSCFKTVGDCPDFAQSAEQNGTVPFSETVLKLLLVLQQRFSLLSFLVIWTYICGHQ
jgi:hypothetical protein